MYKLLIPMFGNEFCCCYELPLKTNSIDHLVKKYVYIYQGA